MTSAEPRARLSVRLRSATRSDHDEAQGSGFLDRLASGSLPRAAYADLATQHWFIYETLEQAAVVMAADPVAGPFVFPELTRLPALTDDLAVLTSQDRYAPLPATERYRARLREVAFDRPWAFIAHHYTRYLGDLSGGQYLGPAIAKAYGLDGPGHRFFVFDGVSPPAFRTRYRALLDDLALSPDDEGSLLAEVSEAYRLNIAVLADLKERWVEAFDLTPEAVAQIARHMNDDHAEDNVLIVRGLGGVGTASAARVSGLDADGMEFEATVDGIAVPVRIPFRERLTERRQVRGEAVRMYREACAALGITPEH
ncbi:biliverdin-producing heme oxygenase [Nucisporomicrobium flavum]|uniref:biliverdin-producing heme oxygenase n=1 Tax=Nucisporomicrobium flavum TaxID=2785915 RepID=UPI0027DE79EB|nr:biliverdin-producing heme oxygenase [Nucisporomicrobium flavum]